MSPNFSRQKHPNHNPLKLVSYSIATAMALGIVVSILGEVAGQTQPQISAQQPAQLAEAEELIEQANKLYEQGKYSKATPLQEKALAIQEKVLGKEHPKIATTLNDLGEFYQAQGIYLNAEPMYLRSLAIREKVLGKEHPDVAESLYNMAEIYRLQGNSDASEPLYFRSLAIREKVLGKEHPKVATTMEGVLELYKELRMLIKLVPQVELDKKVLKEKIEQLKSFVLRSQAIREKMLDKGYPDVATNLYHLAKLYRMSRKLNLSEGGYEKAETLLLSSLAIREKVLGKEHPDVANTLYTLAQLYEEHPWHNEEKAKALYLRSLAIREKVLGKEHPDVATILYYLARLEAQAFNFEKAESMFLRSLLIRGKVLGKEHLDVGITLLSMAHFLFLDGDKSFSDYREMFTISIAKEPLYLRLLPIIEDAVGKESYFLADILQQLGTIYREIVNYNEAERFYLRSLAIFEKVFGKENLDMAHVLKDLAILYKLQENYTKAESVLLRSLAIQEEESGENKEGNIAPTLNYLSLIYKLQGNYTKAEYILLRSLAIQEKESGEKEGIAMAITLNYLGVVYQSQGNYTKAESVLSRSLAISEKHNNYGLTTRTSLNNLAILYWVQGKISKATDFFSRILAIEEKRLQLIYKSFSEEDKQIFAQTFNESTDIAVFLALKQSAKNPTISKLALTTVLRRKGRVLDAMTDIVQTLRLHLEDNPKIKKSFDKWLDVQQQLAELVYRGWGKQNIELNQNKIKQLQLEKENLEHQLSYMSGEFRKENQPIELASIQAKIPQDAALVEIIQYQPFNLQAQYHKRFAKPRYAAVVLRSEGSPSWVDLGDAATIDKSVTSFRKVLASPVKPKSSIEKIARTLDEQVMAPIRPLLGNAHHLLLSPDGQLNLIPFEALKDEKNQYLVQRYAFSYLTTGRDLLKLEITAKKLSPPVVFADIDYEQQDTILVAMNRGSQNQRSVDFVSLKYSSLAATKKESELIKKIFPNTNIISGKQATETAIKALPTPSILHLATHGFFLPNKKNDLPTNDLNKQLYKAKALNLENPLLRSGLALAGFNNRQSKQSKNTEDGVLTALEVAGLNLRGTPLVVLSACETGLGEVKTGDGVYGLRRALVIAGSQTQLLSLWQVDDGGTKDLMVKYYEKLKAGKGRHEALREVQLQLINDSNYQHPYYWASFIPSGNWKGMKLTP